VIAGVAASGPEAFGLVEEMGEHLRALLRDVLCGHLDTDLVWVADSLVAQEAEGTTGVQAEAQTSVAEAPGAAEAEPADQPLLDTEPAGAPA